MFGWINQHEAEGKHKFLAYCACKAKARASFVHRCSWTSSSRQMNHRFGAEIRCSGGAMRSSNGSVRTNFARCHMVFLMQMQSQEHAV